MKRFTTILALIAAVVLTDAQWAVMQSISWAEMVFTDQHGAEVTLLDVVLDTVSGKKELCAKCRIIEKERNSEQQKTLELISKIGIVVPINFSRFSLNLPDGQNLNWSLADAIRPGDAARDSIDHPPQV